MLRVQAEDARFVNASVEFDLASLKPTYRLLWGRGGQSNALAVAQGLGFDPNLVKRAREIAAHKKVGSPPSGQHASCACFMWTGHGVQEKTRVRVTQAFRAGGRGGEGASIQHPTAPDSILSHSPIALVSGNFLT